jgi:hypothetical protein
MEKPMVIGSAARAGMAAATAMAAPAISEANFDRRNKLVGQARISSSPLRAHRARFVCRLLRHLVDAAIDWQGACGCLRRGTMDCVRRIENDGQC